MNNAKVYFSPPEEEIIEHLQSDFGITYIEACEQVIMQKRELAYIHQQRGNHALARTILKELGEWTDAHEEEFERCQSIAKSGEKKIILL